MKDRECVAFLQWALPRLDLRWVGFRRVRRQVCKRISRRMAELELPDSAAYRARLEADPTEWSILDTYCRISISRFARDRGVFDALAGEVLPGLANAAVARGRRSLRAWSAGCASGEEPYSVRLTWDLAVAPAYPDLELRIVATDSSAQILERARRAIYPASALRELPPKWTSRAFEELDGSYRLREEFRADVELRQEDIRKVMPVGPFDLILCRNLVFTYFEQELQREILAELVKRLVSGGALLVGSHESLPELALVARSPVAAGLYRRVKEDRP
jgi:chemotaxis protein methyltransferase CheR